MASQQAAEGGQLVASALTVPSRGAVYKADGCDNLIAHTLRAGGHDASEDGTGRGVPLIPVGIDGGDIAHAVNGDGSKFGSGRQGQDTFVCFDTTQISSPGNYSCPKPGQPCHPLAAGAHPPAVAFQWHGSNIGPMGTLKTGNGNVTGGVPFTIHGSDDCRKAASQSETAQTIRCRPPGSIENSSTTVAMTRSGVRRLTPTECERLQGFPDEWTRLADDGAEISDSARYRMLGNAIAVPVAEWIMGRIAKSDNSRS